MKKSLAVGFFFVFATVGMLAQCGVTMNFAGKDKILVVSDIPQKDVPRLTEDAQKLMVSTHRDLAKVEAYFKKKHLKTGIVDASAYNALREAQMKNCDLATMSPKNSTIQGATEK